MKTIQIALLIFLLFSVNCQRKERYSDETKRKIEKLIISKKSEGKYDCFCRPNNIDTLLKMLTINELMNLMQHETSAIKAYAFSALVDNYYPRLFEIIVENIENKQKIECIYYDGQQTKLLIDFFIEQVDTIYFHYDRKRDSLKLTKEKLLVLDSLLIFKDVSYESVYQEQVLLKVKPKNGYYNRIKSIVLTNNYKGIVALARYKNPNDIPLIKRYIFDKDHSCYAMKAIKEFPSVEFFEDLSKKHNEEIRKKESFDYRMLREMYQAIVQYDNKDAKKLLLKSINEADKEAFEYHKAYIALAIIKHPSEIFKDILHKIKLNEYQEKIIICEFYE